MENILIPETSELPLYIVTTKILLRPCLIYSYLLINMSDLCTVKGH